MILTRIDRPGQRSRAWVTGDRAESCSIAFRRAGLADPDLHELKSEYVQRKDHTFDPALPTWYGGGFWEKVSIGPIGGSE
jgi:hypothetical protein